VAYFVESHVEGETYPSNLEDTSKNYFSIALEQVRHLEGNSGNCPHKCRLGHDTSEGTMLINVWDCILVWSGSMISRVSC
jgi:hypothetical protein